MDRDAIARILRQIVDATVPEQLPLFDLEGELVLAERLEGRTVKGTSDDMQARFGVGAEFLSSIAAIAKEAGVYIGIISSTVGILKAFGLIGKEAAKAKSIDIAAFQQKWAASLQSAGLAADDAELLSLRFTQDVLTAASR